MQKYFLVYLKPELRGEEIDQRLYIFHSRKHFELIKSKLAKERNIIINNISTSENIPELSLIKLLRNYKTNISDYGIEFTEEKLFDLPPLKKITFRFKDLNLAIKVNNGCRDLLEINPNKNLTNILGELVSLAGKYSCQGLIEDIRIAMIRKPCLFAPPIYSDAWKN